MIIGTKDLVFTVSDDQKSVELVLSKSKPGLLNIYAYGTLVSCDLLSGKCAYQHAIKISQHLRKNGGPELMAGHVTAVSKLIQGFIKL